jgi:hypothetical protein
MFESSCFAAQVFTHCIEKLFGAVNHKGIDSFVSSLGIQVDQIGDCEVPIKFLLRLATRVLLESEAIIVFVEDKNPRRYKVHLLHLLQLSPLLLSLRQELI